VTEAWSIVLVLLGCPVVLGLLLMVLSAVEDSLTSPSPAAPSPAQPSPVRPEPAVESRPVGQAPIQEGAPV
jgi:hypothetical protein